METEYVYVISPGQRVKIVAGPFRGCFGEVVEWSFCKDRVAERVLVKLDGARMKRIFTESDLEKLFR